MKIPGFDLDEDLTLELIERLGLKEVLQTNRKEREQGQGRGQGREQEREQGREQEREQGRERGQEREGVSPLKFQLSDGGNNLSGGQKQRLGLLRSLQVKRPIMILDEATSDLDHESRNQVFEILRERAAQGCTILLVTHDRQIADQCDANFVLPHGKSVKMTSYL
jgi:ABC-type lipoprotein export system ATPase subunit